MAARGVVLFHTVHDLFRLEAELKKGGVACRPIPTPRELSSDCGSALSFGLAAMDAVRAAVAELGMDIEGVRQLDS